MKFCAFGLIFLILVLVAWEGKPSSAQPQTQVQIALAVSQRDYAREDLVIVNGKVTDSSGGVPIPLARIALRYFHVPDREIGREVWLTTSSPGGNFEDQFNATTLASLGQWFLNVTFPEQRGYSSTSQLIDFYVKAKTGLTINVAPRSGAIGDEITVSGYVFPCVPCVDQIVRLFLGHSDWIQVFDLPLSPRGAPYPVGVYNFTFRPDENGIWRISTFYLGNDFSFNSTSEQIDVWVGVLGLPLGVGPVLAIFSGTALAVVLLLYFIRRKLLGAKLNVKSDNP